MKTLSITLSITLLLFFSGCATKVTMKVLEPAPVDRAAKTKEIAVLPFKDDRYALSTLLEAEIGKYRLDNKPFFQTVSRRDLDKVIEEQKLGMSGLIDEANAVDVGELVGAKAIITGTVTNSSVNTSNYKEDRKRCIKKDDNDRCEEYQKYKITCKERKYTQQATIKMIDTRRGDLIYSDNFSRSTAYTTCPDRDYTFPETKSEMHKLGLTISRDFVSHITPSYHYMRVTLLDEGDTDYSDRDEELLEASLEYIEAYRLQKAQKLLQRLVESTNRQSYVALYNLGVVYEAQGELQMAKEYFRAADDLTIRPVEEINEALFRINERIAKQQQALEQIEG